MEPSQLKEAIHLLPKIGPVPSPGDDDYVPQDSMCKAIVEAAKAAGYSVSVKDPALKIHRENQVTVPYKTFCRLYVETISLQFSQ